MWTTLTNVCHAWAGVYQDSAILRTAVGFVHIGGLMVGGGTALAEDRAILMAGRGRTPHPRPYEDMSRRGVHAVVLTGLALVLASGVLLFAADIDTYVDSVPFWIKMGLVALLLANGVALTRIERDAQHSAVAWPRLRRAAVVSLSLWLLTTLAGMVLPNV